MKMGPGSFPACLLTLSWFFLSSGAPVRILRYCSDSPLNTEALQLGSKEVEGVSGCRTLHASNLLVVTGYGTLLYSGLSEFWILFFCVHFQLTQIFLAAMILSIFFGVRAYWASRRSHLLQVFYRDGTFYFIVLAGNTLSSPSLPKPHIAFTVMSVGNAIAALFLPVSPLPAVSWFTSLLIHR
jgi:hypothetical protein